MRKFQQSLKAARNLSQVLNLPPKIVLPQYTLFFYKNRSLDSGKKISKQSQACCPTERKRKWYRLATLKMIRTSEQGLAATYIAMHAE